MLPGEYKAEVIGAGVRPDKNNEPQPFIKFKTDQGEITWFGNLKSVDSQAFAVKAAVTAGFHGNDWDQFAEGVAYFNEADIKITVVEEEYKGKTSLKVKWINSGKSKSMSPIEVKSKISSAGLFAQTKKETGVRKSAAEDTPF